MNKLPKDSHLSDEEAACLVCSGVTAWNALFGSSESFTPGQIVLMLGTGGISITASILAKAAGVVTIITSSPDEKLNYVKEKYGADFIINYQTNADWEKKKNGGNGTISKSLASVKFGGQISIVGVLFKVKEMPDILTSVLSKAITARGILVGSKRLDEGLIQFVHSKKPPMPVEKVFGFSEEEVCAAYENIQNQTRID